LRHLREEKGYTLTQLCGKFQKIYNIALNPNLMGKIERSESRISTDVFLLLCQFYKVNLQFFFNLPEGYSDESRTASLLSENPRRKVISKFLLSASTDPWKFEMLADIIQILIPRIEGHFNDLKNDPSSVRTLKAASRQREDKW